MKVYILGGGPTGLAVAHALVEETDAQIVLLERGDKLGGLAQTLQWDGHRAHDLGPHKIFTLDKELMCRVESLLPAVDWLTREKKSAIFMGGHFLPYPPSPFSLIRVFGYVAFVKMTLGYAWASARRLFSSAPPRTFEEDLKSRVGSSLYEARPARLPGNYGGRPMSWM